MAGISLPFQSCSTGQLFKHAQLETVKAWLADPAHGALALHARIQRAVRQLILDGTLGVGKPLPASRALATSLGVSRDTVEAAYGQLHAEGFIERRVGSGSFVSERARRAPGRRAATPWTGVSVSLSRRGQALYEGGGVRDFPAPRPFAPGVPETRSFPLATWERLQRQVLRDHGHQALAHSPPQGMPALRRAIADYVNLERGAQASPEQVLVLTSSQQAMALCAQVLLDPGDTIAIEDPVYPGARKAFEAGGLRTAPIPLDAQGMQVALLQALSPAPKAVFLTPSHQFPTGVTLALERRLAVIEWARRQQAWIIEDDYDSEFHYAGKPMACVQGLDRHGRTIYIGTFTKSLFPGLRIGYMVLPPALVAPMTVARTLLDGHSAPLPQLTLARFMEAGHFGAHVRAMRAVYADRRDVLARLLRRHLGDMLTPQVPAGGMQLPCLLADELSETVLIARAARQQIELTGLTPLHQLTPAAPGVLMGFAAYAPREMQAAIKLLSSAWREA